MQFLRSSADAIFDTGDIFGAFRKPGNPGVVGLWLDAYTVVGSFSTPPPLVEQANPLDYVVPKAAGDAAYMFARGFVWPPGSSFGRPYPGASGRCDGAGRRRRAGEPLAEHVGCTRRPRGLFRRRQVVVAHHLPRTTGLDAGPQVRALTGAEHVAACAKSLDLIHERAFRHLGQGELANALRGAKARPLTDAWAWSRKSSSGDIAAVIALTLALAVGSEISVE